MNLKTNRPAKCKDTEQGNFNENAKQHLKDSYSIGNKQIINKIDAERRFK